MGLAFSTGVSADGVIEAARELLGARNFPSVVAVATGVLENDPSDIAMRLLRAEALVALRRDDEAQSDLRECLRRQVRCARAYHLLGALCFRRDELDSAAVFLREAIRLDPDDGDARDLLSLISGIDVRPTAVVEKLPAATAAVGPFSSNGSGGRAGAAAAEPTIPRAAAGAPSRPRRLARGTVAPIARATDELIEELIDDELTASTDSITDADPPDPAIPLDL